VNWHAGKVAESSGDRNTVSLLVTTFKLDRSQHQVASFLWAPCRGAFVSAVDSIHAPRNVSFKLRSYALMGLAARLWQDDVAIQ